MRVSVSFIPVFFNRRQPKGTSVLSTCI